MKIFASTIFLIALFAVNVSYGETIKWSEGSVVLKSKEVLRGKLFVEQAYDLVLFKTDSQLLVLPAHKLSAIYYYDEANNINRKFLCIKQKERFHRDELYEIVLSGALTVVRRIKSNALHVTDDAREYQYFVRDGDTMTAIEKFRTKVYPYLNMLSGSLPDFVRRNKLDPNSSADAITIIQHYNKDKKQDEMMTFSF